MTAREAAVFVGCSVSTLRRYECWLCERSALEMLLLGCGAYYGEKCYPLIDKPWPPKKC